MILEKMMLELAFQKRKKVGSYFLIFLRFQKTILLKKGMVRIKVIVLAEVPKGFVYTY